MEDDEDEDEELLLLRIKALKSTTRVNINVEFNSDSDNDVSVSKRKKTPLRRRKKVDTPRVVQQREAHHSSASEDDDEERKLREIALSSLQKGKSRSRIRTPSAIQHDLISSTSGEQGSSSNTNNNNFNNNNNNHNGGTNHHINNNGSFSHSLAEDLNLSALIDFAIERPTLPLVTNNAVVLPELSVNDTGEQGSDITDELAAERGDPSPTSIRDTTSTQSATVTIEGNAVQVVTRTPPASNSLTTQSSEVQIIADDSEQCDDVLSLCASDKDENELVDMLLPTSEPKETKPAPTISHNSSGENAFSITPKEGPCIETVSTDDVQEASAENSSTDATTTSTDNQDDAQPGPSGYIKPTIVHGYGSESEESLIDTTPAEGEQSQNTTTADEGTEESVNSLGTSQDENGTDETETKDSTCSVCLGPFQNRSFLNFCFHSFCYTCIMQWSELSRSCPLCKSKYTSLIHSVNNDLDYETYEFPTDLPSPEEGSRTTAPPEFSETMEDGRRFRYRSTMVDPDEYERRRNDRERAQRDFVQSTQERRMKRRLKWSGSANKDVRKGVYKKGLKIKEVKQKGKPKCRDISPKFFSDNPALKHRLVPWLLRDLNVLLGDDDESIRFVMSLILRVISTLSMNETPFREQLRPFLFEETDIFVDELVSFASSPYDIRGYDANVRYSKPEKEVEIVGVTKQPIHVSDSETTTETNGVNLLHEVFLADQDGEGPLTVHDGNVTPVNENGLPVTGAPLIEVSPETLFVTVQNDIAVNAVNGEGVEGEDIEDGDDEGGNETESDDEKDGSKRKKKLEKKKKGKRKRRRSKEEKERRDGKEKRKKKKSKKDKDQKAKESKHEDAISLSKSVDDVITLDDVEDSSAAFLRKDESELVIEDNNEPPVEADVAKCQPGDELAGEKKRKVKEEEERKRKKIKRSKKLVEMAKKRKNRSKYKHLKREKRLKRVEKPEKRKRKKVESSSEDDEGGKKVKKSIEKHRRKDMSPEDAKEEKKEKIEKKEKSEKKEKGEKKEKVEKSRDDGEKEKILDKTKRKKDEEFKIKKSEDTLTENEKRKHRHRSEGDGKKSLKRKRDQSESERSAEKRKKKDKTKSSPEGKEGKEKRKKPKIKKRKRKEKHGKPGAPKTPEKEGSGKDVADKDLRTKIDKIRSMMTKRSCVSSDDDDDDFLNSDEVKDLLRRYKYNDNKDLIKDGDAYRTRGEMVRELLLIEKAITRRKEKKQQKQNSKNESSKSASKGLPNGKGKSDVKANGMEMLNEKALKKAEREKSYMVLIQELQEIEGRINSCRSSLQAKPCEAGVAL